MLEVHVYVDVHVHVYVELINNMQVKYNNENLISTSYVAELTDQ